MKFNELCLTIILIMLGLGVILARFDYYQENKKGRKIMNQLILMVLFSSFLFSCAPLNQFSGLPDDNPWEI